ncbi:hypothetical protein MMC09_007014 [Bachmanniomyces sp. S44760]|nr:hypothetical protein [Bachmanniomyces sp. S44760]
MSVATTYTIDSNLGPDPSGDANIYSTISFSHFSALSSVPSTIITGTPWGSKSSTAARTTIPTKSSQVTSLTSVLSSSSSTSLPTAAAASVTPIPPKPVLSKPQIAGVTIAGVASGALAFGVLFCLFVIRRRHDDRRNSGSSFGADQASSENEKSLESSASVSASSFAIPAYDQPRQQLRSPPRAPQFLRVPNAGSPSQLSLWRRSARLEDIGVAIGPGPACDLTQENSPMSAASYRTISQLLPEKPIYSQPSYSLFPGIARTNSSMAPEAATGQRAYPGYDLPSVPAPKAVHQSWNARSSGMSGVQRHDFGSQPRYPTPLLGLPPDPRAQMYAMEHGQRALPSHLPRIATPESHGPLKNSWVPPASQRPSSLQAAGFSHSGEPGTGTLSSPAELESPEDVPRSPLNNSVYPTIASAAGPSAIRNAALYPAPLQQRPKRNIRRPITQFTTGSETSFEDEITPPEEPRRNLGNPNGPLNQIRYPSIPGSAATSPGRRTSPNSNVPGVPGTALVYTAAVPIELPARSDSLLAKRLGPHAAAHMARGFEDRHANATQQSNKGGMGAYSPDLHGLERTVAPDIYQYGNSNRG